MSDCEETDFFWKSWSGTLPKGKRKKDSKKDIKRLKHKSSESMETAMEGWKEKKKGKNKNKKKLALEQEDIFILTQGSGAQAKPAVKPEPWDPNSSEELKPHQDRKKKKNKKKKKVAFDLSPRYRRAKRPKLASSSQQSLTTAMGHSQGETHANESQCNSEEINSQDLFITQKTFRASPQEPSSGESSDKAVPSTSSPMSASLAWMKRHLDGPYGCPRDSGLNRSQTNEKPKVKKEDEERIIKAHQNPKKRQLTGASRPAHTTPSVVNAYLGEPIAVKPPLDVGKSKRQSCPFSQQSPSSLSDEPCVSTRSTSTQTENFSPPQLSTYLSFCRQTRASAHLDHLKALDLSLPHRARNNLSLSAKTLSLPGEIKEHPCCSSDMKGVEVKKEPSGQRPCSVSTQETSETSQRAQSESELKITDTTTSSQDEPPCRTGKPDLTQVRAVQLRLNESFFFKAKGEGQSPRPESPLMKLAQGRQVKKRKSH